MHPDRVIPASFDNSRLAEVYLALFLVDQSAWTEFSGGLW